MFKRRKPDDEPEAAIEAHPATPTPPDPAAGAPDTGLGVPPRPTLPALAPFKDPIMGRPPFATPLAPVNPVPVPSGNQQGGGMAMPGAGPPRAPGPPLTRPAMGREAVAAPERRTLVVGRGISVQGMVQDAERLVVEGTVEASMINAAELSVAPGGVFRGEVEVEDAEVAGTVDGTLTARGNLVVRATGVVLGTARCRRLQVEDGGRITGRMEMLTEAASTKPSTLPVPVPSYES